MAIVKCDNDHFYDNQRYSACPYCDGTFESDKNENYTIALNSVERQENFQKTVGYFESAGANDKTIALYLKEGVNDAVVGWLVCTEGDKVGCSFLLHSGRNFIGRSLKMDIVLPDEQVNRENHCSIIFEPKECQFFFTPGKGSSYVNKKYIDIPVEIKENDELLIGSTNLIFVPYCKEGRGWK